MITTEPLFMQSPVATSILDLMGQRVARNEAYRSLIDPDAATPSSVQWDAPAPSARALDRLLTGEVPAVVAEHPVPGGDDSCWVRSTTVLVTERDGAQWFVQTTVPVAVWTTERPTTTHWEDLELDPEARAVTVSGTRVHLTRIEFELLAALIDQQGAICSRRALVKQAWGADCVSDDHVVDVHMANLRKKIDLDGRRHITTVRGFGYRLT